MTYKDEKTVRMLNKIVLFIVSLIMSTE